MRMTKGSYIKKLILQLWIFEQPKIRIENKYSKENEIGGGWIWIGNEVEKDQMPKTKTNIRTVQPLSYQKIDKS